MEISSKNINGVNVFPLFFGRPALIITMSATALSSIDRRADAKHTHPQIATIGDLSVRKYVHVRIELIDMGPHRDLLRRLLWACQIDSCTDQLTTRVAIGKKRSVG